MGGPREPIGAVFTRLACIHVGLSSVKIAVWVTAMMVVGLPKGGSSVLFLNSCLTRTVSPGLKGCVGVPVGQGRDIDTSP
ncbi:hypothetical protein FKM82_007339 [Ascaphus truei]